MWTKWRRKIVVWSLGRGSRAGLDHLIPGIPQGDEEHDRGESTGRVAQSCDGLCGHAARGGIGNDACSTEGAKTYYTLQDDKAIHSASTGGRVLAQKIGPKTPLPTVQGSYFAWPSWIWALYKETGAHNARDLVEGSEGTKGN